MKSFVITIMDNERSVQVANRCIRSGSKVGIDIEKWNAITPSSVPDNLDIPTDLFREVYSRFENCVAAFLSHHSLWEECVARNEKILILEHDAMIVDNIPTFKQFKHVMNIGKPSYGKAQTPMSIGVNKLTSKPYFPGAHAYMLTPQGARLLIEKAKTHAAPTDVFLSLKNFPTLEEYYPWPVEARDSFTTIQKERGCLAKHNYGETYDII
jgi:GR25 family glycosyltransferase involved in LPS biosynthesis